jgi:hypothetical protein
MQQFDSRLLILLIASFIPRDGNIGVFGYLLHCADVETWRNAPEWTLDLISAALEHMS